MAGVGTRLRCLGAAAAVATVLALGAVPTGANDPAGSWLAYTVATATDGRIITYMNATTVVPKDPTAGGATPAFWPGLEPSPATNILQPILKWQGDAWSIFVEYFQWSDFHDWQSQAGGVQAGDTVFTSITYVPHNDSYNMWVHSARTGFGVGGNIPVQTGKTYVSAYLVVEHQPMQCNQFPASGKITWTDVNVVWKTPAEVKAAAAVAADDATAHAQAMASLRTPTPGASTPAWTAHTYQDQCGCKGDIENKHTIAFTWSTSGTSAGAAAGGGGLRGGRDAVVAPQRH